MVVFHVSTFILHLQQSGAVIQDYQRQTHYGEILNQIRANLQEIQNNAPVAVITGNEFQKTANDKRSLREKVIEFFNSIGNKVFRSGMGEIALNTVGVRDSLAHGYGRLKAATFTALPNVLTDGTIISKRGPYEGHDYDSYLIAAPVTVGKEKVYVGALVIRDEKTKRYKLHEVLTASEDGAPLFQSESGENASPLRNDAPSESPLGSPDGILTPGTAAVNGGPEGLRLPTVEETQVQTGQTAGGGTELPLLFLPEVEGARAHPGRDTGRELESLRLRLPTVERTEPETFSEAIMRQLTGGTPQTVPQPETADNIEPKGLSLPTVDGTEPQTGRNYNNGPERLSLPDSEDGLLKMFKSMGVYKRGDGSVDIEFAKADYRKFLQNVPEKNKMYLEQALDAVEYIQCKLKTAPFAYDPEHDVIYYDPDHPDFTDYDFRVVNTHELAHRIGDMLAHSTGNAEFSRAIVEAVAVVDSCPEFFLSYCKKQDEEGFLSDILDAICESKYDFPTGHDYEYWQSPDNKMREIFANLFSLEAFGDTQKWIFLENNFPDLIRTYLNFGYYI